MDNNEELQKSNREYYETESVWYIVEPAVDYLVMPPLEMKYDTDEEALAKAREISNEYHAPLMVIKQIRKGKVIDIVGIKGDTEDEI